MSDPISGDSSNEAYIEKIANEIPETYSLPVAILVTLNCCIVGSIFGVPWGFNQSGWAFALGISIFIFIILCILAIMVIQIISRMRILHGYSNQGYTIRPVPIKELFSNYPESRYIFKDNEEGDNVQLIPENIKNPLNYKYDFAIMSKILLGKALEKVMIFLIICIILAYLMGCTTGFASSLVSLIPIGPLDTCDIYLEPSFYDSCRYKYMFYVFVLFFISIVLSLFFHFTEHKYLIITCCLLRITVILTMIITAIYSYSKNEELDSDEELSVSSTSFELYGIGVTSSIMFLTIGYHILIPEMIQPLKNKEKNAIPMILIVLTLGFILSVALGITMCLTLNDVQQQITLNWKYYSNGKNPSDRDWWAYIIDAVISICPAIDVLSQIFLSVSNVTDNIVSVTYADLKEFDVDKKFIFKIRIIVIIVSTFIPLYFYDLGYFLSITGNFVVTMNVLFINSFALASLTLVPQKCPYDNFIASKKFTIFFFILTLLFMIVEWIGFLSFLVLN
ncbi:hypothetical protein SteCoe_21512 [Stentor coeruleus]|uniref:Amino acid transporter transmembrane domain-containing protein n=1 Tax=Stentor coeruleus TaxID=5963 RepID=A0A1R2BPW5_9CILI|nr:hypothetical protein SteCoe_21512 [Stentor coeruleus]